MSDVKKIAARLRMKARGREKHPVNDAGIVQFGIWDDVLLGHNPTVMPLCPEFKGENGSRIYVVSVAVGDDFVAVITDSNDVFFSGQDLLHENEASKKWTKLAIAGGGGAKIVSGSGHLMVLNQAQKILTWGHGGEGQLGHGDFNNRPQPSLLQSFVQQNVDIVDVAAHGTMSMAISLSGSVYVWGHAGKTVMDDAAGVEKTFIQSNKPIKLNWGTRLEMSRNPRLGCHAERLFMFYPSNPVKTEKKSRSQSRSISPSRGKRSTTDEKDVANGDEVAHRNAYMMGQLKDMSRQLVYLKKPFPNIRNAMAELTFDEGELFRLRESRSKLIKSLQSLLEQTQETELLQGTSKDLVFLKSVVMDSIETQMELENLRIEQIDDARKGRLIGRFRRKLERAHVGDIVPDNTWSLDDVALYRELVFESTNLLTHLAEEVHGMAMEFSAAGHLSLPMQSAALLAELASLRRFVNEHSFFTLRGVLQDGQDGLTADFIASGGSIQLRHTVQKLIHLWGIYDNPQTLENVDRVKNVLGELQLLKTAAAGENTGDFDPEDMPLASQLVQIVMKCFTAYRLKFEHEAHH